MMGRVIGRLLIRDKGSPGTASSSRALIIRGVAGCSAFVLLGVGAIAGFPEPPGQPPSAASISTLRAEEAAAAAAAARKDAAPFGQIILPDLLVVSQTGITSQQLASLSKISGVRHMIAFDGAEIDVGGRPASVIGVDPDQFRSWVPLQTASDQPFWTALSGGEFVASQSARTSLGLKAGASYQLTGSTIQTVRFGASATLGIGGVDLLVNSQVSRQLGLVHQVAALISAPGARLTTLISQVKGALGSSAKIESLRPQQRQQLPVTKSASGGTPTTYLQLFQDSAADYCPGLSWTVLAAIGQIESADGTNDGPSTAGALGPMQFLPSTWAVWGIDAFGQTGTPNIMNPYDAVASAARMLCADGAASGGNGLSGAIFDYNHATWYVNEVLGLAAEYAQDYPA
jgi:hypothetical protein